MHIASQSTAQGSANSHELADFNYQFFRVQQYFASLQQDLHARKAQRILTVTNISLISAEPCRHQYLQDSEQVYTIYTPAAEEGSTLAAVGSSSSVREVSTYGRLLSSSCSRSSSRGEMVASGALSAPALCEPCPGPKTTGPSEQAPTKTTERARRVRFSV